MESFYSHRLGSITHRSSPVSAGEPAASRTEFTGQYIDGVWRPGRSGKTLADVDPFTGATITTIELASEQDLNDAYVAAASAQKSWARMMPSERSSVFLRATAVMDDRHEEIVSLLIRESGSTRIKAEMEWSAVRGGMLEAASLPGRVNGRIQPIDVPGKESRTYRVPLGVIGVISPWNWPLHLSHRSIAPALALGNAVVVKPADDTPITGGLLLGSIYEDAGLPPGLLNVVVGDLAEVGDSFTLHPIPKFISFTGSTRVGRHIGELALRGSIKRVGLELGGNAPLVILDDADIEQAVRAAVFGRFLHQGQICMSTNRIIVHEAVYNNFVARFVEQVRTLKYGDPNEADTAIGPVINRRQLEGILARIHAARAAGLNQVIGGEPQGQVLPPHVFIDVNNSSDLAQSELFGPVAVVIKAENEAHAVELANQTDAGLSSAVFSADEGRALKVALQIEAGMTHINDVTVNDSPNIMFGGEKNSGIGRFNGDWIIAEFTRDHSVTLQREKPNYPF